MRNTRPFIRYILVAFAHFAIILLIDFTIIAISWFTADAHTTVFYAFLGLFITIKTIDFIIINLLLIGILLTNSRAIMIITAFAYLLILIFNKKSIDQSAQLKYRNTGNTIIRKL